SIFAWSIGNEIDYPNDPYSHPVLSGTGKDGFTQPIFGGYQKESPDAMRLGTIAKKLASVVRQYDKSRPVTAALAGVAMSNETEYPGALDIAGYNYTESFYLSDHKKYPNRVIYGSENGHSFDAWKAVTENPYIFGQFLWTGIDYLGEAGSWPSRGFSAGLLDLGGFVKPRGYFRQSLWSDKPMAYIGTYLLVQNNERTPSIDALPVWNYDASQTIRVACYTNAAKARLELNGKQVGDIQNYNHQTGIIYWDIPYQAGKLEVIGLDKGNKEIARYAIQSSKQPDALTITICHVEKAIDRNKELTQIIVQVVDENGVPVLLSDNEVTCHISGPAKLLGLEAGNITDMTDYTDNKQRVFHGCLIAYIQTSGEKGEIKVQFSSPWLKSTETIIQAANSD
ncbi:Beta-galactosidase BoGH2A, partial [termite gut metagenome]